MSRRASSRTSCSSSERIAWRLRAPGRPRRRSRSSSARSSRSGTRRSAPSRAACRRRSRRGGTTRRPTRALHGRRVARRRCARKPTADRRVAARVRVLARSARSVTMRNQASHTLSPRPSTPTRFMPSFQSPMPISGRPCAPVVHALAQRAQAVLVHARRAPSDDLRQVVDLVLVAARARASSRNGTTSSSTAASPVTRT